MKNIFFEVKRGLIVISYDQFKVVLVGGLQTRPLRGEEAVASSAGDDVDWTDQCGRGDQQRSDGAHHGSVAR